MNRTLIKVTQEHIDSGITNSCYKCPIALAVNELVKPSGILVGASVNTLSIRYFKNDKLNTFLTPRSAQRFIKRFDRKLSVKPFNFYLKEY